MWPDSRRSCTSEPMHRRDLVGLWNAGMSFQLGLMVARLRRAHVPTCACAGRPQLLCVRGKNRHPGPPGNCIQTNHAMQRWIERHLMLPTRVRSYVRSIAGSQLHTAHLFGFSPSPSPLSRSGVARWNVRQTHLHLGFMPRWHCFVMATLSRSRLSRFSLCLVLLPCQFDFGDY